MSDQINHPPHYTSHPSGVECIQVVEHMNFNIGNAIKYLWRAGLKGALVEDLKRPDGTSIEKSQGWKRARSPFQLHSDETPRLRWTRFR